MPTRPTNRLPLEVRGVIYTLGALLLVWTCAAVAYLGVFYDWSLSCESATEAAFYAMQTVTTVGYGGWETPALKNVDAIDRHKVLLMRALSVPLMAFGGLAYAAFTGVIVALIIRKTPDD